ncbi:MAG: helix-turn-helix domain-containing protein [Burkholderiales bacterium]|nr:helix-turn-helix domain-containing protein [Burkholderiales bacterium]
MNGHPMTDDDDITKRVRASFVQHLRGRMDATPSLDTQVKLATAAGIAQSSVQRMLSGAQSPTIDILYRLAVAFGDTSHAHFLLPQSQRNIVTLLEGLSPADLARVEAVIRAIDIESSKQNGGAAGTTQVTSQARPGELAPAARQSGTSIAAEPGIVNVEVNEQHKQRGRRSA